jgi:hypothetical protein
VVVNHALLLSDIVSDSNVLPAYRHLIIDEAHNLEEEATEQWGVEVGERDLRGYFDSLGQRDGVGRYSGLLFELAEHFRGSAVPLTRQHEIGEMAGDAYRLVERGRDRMLDLFDALWRFMDIYARDSGGYERRLRITAAERQAAGTGTSFSVLGSSIPISVPIGGVQVLTASPANTTDPTKTGWARVESSGGQIGGVGTFQYSETAGNLVTIAGVLSADPVTVATIPVDNDNGQSRQVGYAVANSGTSPITIKVDVVDASGNMQKTFNITLNPGAQLAKFLWQDDATFQTFRGSLVLIGQGSASFSVVALVQNGSLYTVIPVIPFKATGIN